MKTLKYLAFAAAIVAMLGACQKEIDTTNPAETGSYKTFTVTANYTEPIGDTKTEFVNGISPYVKWLSTDTIVVFEHIDSEFKYYHSQKKESGISLYDDGRTAQFSIDLFTPSGKIVEGSKFCYTAFYPSNCICESSSSPKFYYFEIPENQVLNNNNFATGSDILIGKPIEMSSRISESSNLNIQFKRPGTVVALTVKGITANEKISSIQITAPAGNYISGRCKVDRKTGEVTEKAYSGGVRSNIITLNCSDAIASGNDVFYFRCIDGTWASGSNVSIKVTTDQAEYTKTSTLSKDYVFADGGLTRFGFKNMTRKGGLATYQKYTGTLIEGDYIICSGTTAMGNVISSDRMGYQPVSIADDKIKTKDSTIIWHIADDGDYWTLYNAAVNTYAASTGAKNKIQLLSSKDDDKAKWTTTGSSEREFVNKQNTANSVNANLRYNDSYGFACYSTSTGGALTLYINSEDLKDPLATPSITVTEDNFTKTISVSWSPVPNATEYEISCTGQDKISTTGTSCQFTSLAAGEYSVSVKAVDNTGTYRASKTQKNVTLYDPTVTLSTTSITNVPAAGDIRNDITYSLYNAEEADLAWTYDGTIVSEVVADKGEVTYTVEANTTANTRDGWIKVTLNGNVKTITVSQLGLGAKQDQSISFGKSSYTVKMGETITQTVSGAKTAVTYSSSNTGIATVDAYGKVTPVAAGSCTITATAAEDETYEQAEASYTLTVQENIKTWTYAVSSGSPEFNSSSSITINSASWSIKQEEKKGSPTINGTATKASSYYGWKWGNNKDNYWGSYTLSTDYFTSKKVKSVTVNFLNNGSKSATMTVKQGSTTIGSATETFGSSWTDLTANTTPGTSGTLTIQYTVAQASYIHSITVEYID